MSEELVMTEKHGHVQVLTLNRPEDMNAFNTALAAALGDALDAMDNDADVRVGVLTCLLYTSPSPRDGLLSRMPSSA